MWGGRRKKVGEREEGVGSAGEPASARPRAAAAARTVAGGGGGRRRQPGEGCGRRRGVPPESPTRATRGEGSTLPNYTLLPGILIITKESTVR